MKSFDLVLTELLRGLLVEVKQLLGGKRSENRLVNKITAVRDIRQKLSQEQEELDRNDSFKTLHSNEPRFYRPGQIAASNSWSEAEKALQANSVLSSRQLDNYINQSGTSKRPANSKRLTSGKVISGTIQVSVNNKGKLYLG